MHSFFALGLPHGFEWLWIGLIVIVLFGADKLPKLARGLGRSLGEFKKAKEEFDKEIHAAVNEENKPIVDKTLPVTPVNSVPTSDGLSKKI